MTAEQLAAALAAGPPPVSDDYPVDAGWHTAQDGWLARWKPGLQLPGTNDPKRRTEWNALSKKGLRHFEAAEAASNQEAASSESTPRVGSAPPPPPTTSAPPPVAPSKAASSKQNDTCDDPQERKALHRMLRKRGVPHKKSDTTRRLIARLARHEKLLAPEAHLIAMPPVPALPLASSAMRTIHELREDCRRHHVEYSISETPEQLQQKLQTAHASASAAD